MTKYQDIVGCLQWLATCDRPNISFAASYLAQDTADPRDGHWELALGVAMYLQASKETVFKLNNSPIVWSSRRQATVALLTVEAEYIAVSEAAREMAWLRGLLGEINYGKWSATVLHCDKQGLIRLAFNPATHQRTKHIDIKHFVN